MSDLPAVFKALRSILAPHAKNLQIKTDTETNFYVDTQHIQKNKSPLFFGAVQIKKSFISYHLMPVYVQPALLDTISPELRQRMQGKSCFNFSTVDAALFKELAALTQAGYTSYQSQGFV